MNPQLIIALIIALASAGTTWRIQSWYYAAKESNRERQTYELSLESERLARRAETANSTRTITALNAANARAATRTRDADSSRAALNSVSYAAGEALRSALRSHDACLATATATGELLVAVSAERRDLAEKADGHVSDILTLTQSWPKCSTK